MTDSVPDTRPPVSTNLPSNSLFRPYHCRFTVSPFRNRRLPFKQEVAIPHQNGEERELLAGIATDLLRFKDSRRLLESVLERLTARMQIELCLAYSLSDGKLEPVFLGGLAPEWHLLAGTIGLEDKLLFVNSQGLSLSAAEIQAAPDEGMSGLLKRVGVQAFCSFPLLAGGSLSGILCFGSYERRGFPCEDIANLEAIANQVAVSFDRMTLLRELARSNQELLAANAELRRAHAELEQIAFSASHDLREPVRYLSLYAELLATRLKQLPEDPEALRYLQFVLSKAKRVELLVSDLLDYTGVSHEEPAASAIDSNAVLKKVFARLDNLIEQTGTTVHLSPLPFLGMAEDDLAALFENLIENAIVHHRSGVFPEIRISARTGQEGPVICVRDNGLGIDPAHSDRIFGLFRRLRPESESGATGLGLTLCRKIVGRYGGNIWVESEPGHGATFCFAIRQPVSAAPPAVRSAAAAR